MASGPVKVREIQPYGYQNYNLNIASNLNILRGNLSISENLNIGTNLTITEHLAIGASGDNTEHDLFVNGNIGLNDDGYIYYNTGTDIGLRANSGVMEVKFRSGAWDPISGVSSGIWEKTGSKIYYNTDNVGFKTINPQAKAEVFGNLSVSGNVIITDTTDSIDSLTGAIRVPGGVGVQRDIVIGEDFKITDIAKLDGGADINAAVSISDGVIISNTSESSSLTTGALISQGGLAAQKKLIISGNSIFSSHINMNESVNISQQLVCSNFTTGYTNTDYINATVDSSSILALTSLVGDVTDGTTGITLNPNKIVQGYSQSTSTNPSWSGNMSGGSSEVNNELHNLFNQNDALKWVQDENMNGFNEYSSGGNDGTTSQATKQAHIIVPVKSSISLSSDNKIKITAASDYISSALNRPPSSFQLWGIKKSGAAEPTINPPYVNPGNGVREKANPEFDATITYRQMVNHWFDISGNDNHAEKNSTEYFAGMYDDKSYNGKTYYAFDHGNVALEVDTGTGRVGTIFIAYIAGSNGGWDTFFDLRRATDNPDENIFLHRAAGTQYRQGINTIWMNEDHNVDVVNQPLSPGTSSNTTWTGLGTVFSATVTNSNSATCTLFKLANKENSGAGGGYQFSDHVLEVLLFENELSDANRKTVTQYLNTKWGLFNESGNTTNSSINRSSDSQNLNLSLSYTTGLLSQLDASQLYGTTYKNIPQFTGGGNYGRDYSTTGGKMQDSDAGTGLQRSINYPIHVMIKPVTEDPYNRNTTSGITLSAGDKFVFILNGTSELNNAPSRFELYGCTDRDITVDFATTISNDKYEFSGSGTGSLVKIASNEETSHKSMDSGDTSGMGLMYELNESFGTNTFYWIIVAVYGVNQDITNKRHSANTSVVWKSLALPEQNQDTSNWGWWSFGGDMVKFGNTAKQGVDSQGNNTSFDIQLNPTFTNSDKAIELTVAKWNAAYAYSFNIDKDTNKLVIETRSPFDTTNPLNKTEPVDIGNSCSIELLHSLLDTTDTTNSNGNELTNSSYSNGVYSSALNQSFTAQVYNYLYMVIYTTTYDGTTGYSNLSFANLDIEEESDLPAVGLEVTNDINITNTLTNKTFNVTDSSTVDRNLTANQLSVSKNCNVGGNIVITGNATFEDSLIVKGANTLSVEGKSHFNDDLVILGENKLVSSNTSSNKTIFSDGTDLILTSGVDLNLNASQNINLDTNKKILFGPQIELVGDNVNNFNITTPQDINLTPSTGYNINVAENVGISFKSDTQQLIVDGVNNFNMVAASDINLTPASNQNINLENDIGLSFSQTTDTQQIVSSSGYLSINSSKDVNLTSSAGYNINIPADINITFGSDTEKINADSSNNLNINADKDINITPGNQYNINIPQDKGLVFGADTQSLLGDNVNNFNINAGGDIDLQLLSTNNVNIEKNIGLTFGEDSQKIEVNNSNELTITSGGDINLTPAIDKDVNIPSNTKLTFGSDTQRINANNDNELTFTTAGDINLSPALGYNVNIPVNTGIMFGSDTQKINSDAGGELYIRGDGTLNIADDTITVFNNDTQSTIGGDGSLKVYGGMYIQEDCSVKKDLIIIGNKNIAGESFIADAEQVVIDDPLIIIGANSTTANDDHIMGFVGRYGKQGAGNNEFRFTGLVRDSVEKEFSLLSNIDQSGSNIELPNVSDSDFKNNDKVGDLNIGKLINEDTTNATDYNVGASVITGSIGVEKDIFIQTNKHIKYGNTGRYITADNTDLNLISGSDINLTATNDINILSNIGLTFNSDDTKIESDGSELTIQTTKYINMVPSSGYNVNIPQNIGLSFKGDTQNILSNSSDELVIRAKEDIILRPESGKDINIPANIGLTFKNDTQKIESDSNNDITIEAGRNVVLSSTEDINLTPSTGYHVNVPVNNKMTFGADSEYINGDSNINVYSSKDINLVPASNKDVNILQDIGLTFGADTQKLEADNVNNFNITAGTDINLTPITNVNIPTDKKLTFGADTQNLVGDNVNNFNINSGGDILLTPEAGYNVNIPSLINLTFGDDTQKIFNGNEYGAINFDFTDSSSNKGSYSVSPTYNGGMSSTPSADGIEFENAGDYISLGTHDFNAPLSISCWIKIHSAGHGTNYGRIFTIHDPISSRGLHMLCNSNNLTFGLYDGNPAIGGFNWNNNPDTWIHVVGVLESDNSLKLYVDNTLISSSTAQTYDFNKTFTGVFIGASIQGFETVHNFDGEMHSFAMFNKALSVSEINYLYNSGTKATQALPSNFKIYSGADINLTPAATKDVNIPDSVNLTFGIDNQKIVNDSSDLNLAAACDINLTPATGQDINIQQDIAVTFGTDTQYIEGDSNDNITVNSGKNLTISSTKDINLTPAATKDINVPANIGISFGSDTENIMVDSSNNLTIKCDEDINLTPASNKDVNIPSDINLVFNTTEKMIGDNSNNFNISAAQDINLTPASGYNVNIGSEIGLTFGTDAQKIEADSNSNLVITAEKDISLTPAAGYGINIPENVGVSFGDKHMLTYESEGGNNFNIVTSGDLNLQPSQNYNINIPTNIGLAFGNYGKNIKYNYVESTSYQAVTLTDATSGVGMSSSINTITSGFTLQADKINHAYAYKFSNNDSWRGNLGGGNAASIASLGNLVDGDTTSDYYNSQDMLGWKSLSGWGYDGTTKSSLKNVHIVIPVKSGLLISQTDKIQFTASSDYLGTTPNRPPGSFRIWGIKKTGSSEPKINPPYGNPGNDSEVDINDPTFDATSNTGNAKYYSHPRDVDGNTCTITLIHELLDTSSNDSVNTDELIDASYVNSVWNSTFNQTFTATEFDYIYIAVYTTTSAKPNNQAFLKMSQIELLQASATAADELQINNYSGDINLTPSSTKDVNIPQDISLTFGNDTERLDADSSNNLNILSSEDINLTPSAGQNINIEQDTSIIFGSNNSEKITANSSNELTINANEDINLIPASNQDINIPNEIGLVFGSNDSEKIEVDATNNLTIQASNDVIFDSDNVNINKNCSVSNNVIVSGDYIVGGIMDLKTTTNIENSLNIKNTMVLVPDTVDIVGALGAVVPEQILTSNSLTIIKASGNMTADAKFALSDGSYNGQVKKICLHPSYNLTTSVNYLHEVLIDIDNFYDPDGNPSSSSAAATLVLNKGGQTLNILWIKNGVSGVGYWVLMDSNFDLI